MGYRLFKIVAIGCGKATPTLSIRYQVRPEDTTPLFQYVFPSSFSESVSLINSAYSTAIAAVCRNLHLSVLQEALPKIVQMPKLTAIRLDQCRMTDLLSSLNLTDKDGMKKVTHLSIENLEMTFAQFISLIDLFPGLKVLSLSGVGISYSEQKPQVFSPHLTLTKLVFSPRAESISMMPLWVGGMVCQLFPNLTAVDMTSFPREFPQRLVQWILNFNQFCPVKDKVLITLGGNSTEISSRIQVILNVQIKATDSDTEKAWKENKSTESSA